MKGWLVIGVSMVLCIPAVAAETFKGIVNMGGSILETPCAIAMESLDQTIVLDTVPLASLKQWGEGTRQSFAINIINCRLTSSTGTVWANFSLTFEGPAERNGFSVFGQATGIALRIDDAQGQPILPGEPLWAGALLRGDRKLEYGLRVVSNNSAYTPGDFQSTLRFKLDYD
ncbi:fimbrial protein [Providencia rettgeri]|uniref:fimbrial protein n=1 Tax=Providencia rettgeri TaxID=587 RepID=UPI0034E0CEB6